MRTRIGALLGVTALLLGLAWPAPLASAAGTGWPAAPCATGAFGALVRDGEHILVPATVTPCGRWDEDLRFTVAGFRPGVSPQVFASDLRAYARTAPTLVTADLVTQLTEDIGLCLLASATDRVACVRVTLDPFGSGLAAVPIRTGDDLVAAPVVFRDEDHPHLPSPWCLTCLVIEP
ncbi:hypothetical protein [Actinoplanes sp. NPDC051494]|uniref:hypothetical protein n=1 Tax=Actinoplanes sp. NPDC051494 TaxID=3363907 RepID=UPI0037BBEBBD